MNFNQNSALTHANDAECVTAANDAAAQPFEMMLAHPRIDAEGNPKQKVHYTLADFIELDDVRQLGDVIAKECKPCPSNWGEMEKAERRKAKNALPYICWPLTGKGGMPSRDDNTRRNPNIAPAKWLAFDVDGCGESIFEALAGYDFSGEGTYTGGELANYRAFAYTSSSDAPGDRHFRFVIELTEAPPVDAKQTTALVIEHMIFSAIGATFDVEASAQLKGKNAWRIGDELAIVDGAQYRIAQVAYLPFRDAVLCQGYDGQPVDVSRLLGFEDLSQEFKSRKGRTGTGEAYELPENFKAAVDADPRAQWLIDSDYVTGDNGRNALHIRCPNWENHSDADTRDYNSGDTGSAYMLHDSDPMQRLITCQHASCAELVSNQHAFAMLFADPAMPSELLPVDIRSNECAGDFHDLTEGTATGEPLPRDEGKPFLSGRLAGRQLENHERARLRDLNDEYVHTTAGGKNVVCQITRSNIGGAAVQTLQYIRLPELKDRFISAEPINGFTVQDGDKKRGKPLNLADAWLAWPSHAQKFGGVDFYPNPKQCPRDTYNLFKGYNVTPAAGNVAPYLELVEDIVCGGNKEHAEYVLDFLAHMFQKPEQKPSVAIVMKGGRGIGKGSFVWPLIRIMGMHAAHLTGVNQAAGRFNSVIVGKLLMFFDEMHVTTRDAEDALKTIISEPMISMERKGIDPEPVSNYARVIGASNHADVIRTGEKERRYLLLESSDHRAGDKAYWDSYYQWARAGGASHLLAFLMQRDITDFNPHFAPRTAALQAAMVEDLTPVNRFILEQLREEIPFALPGDEFSDLSVGTKAPTGGEIPTEAVAEGYLEFLNERYPKRFGAWNIDHARNQLKGVFTKGLNVAIAGRKGKGYGRKYIIESFEDVRHAFADLIGVEYSAAFGDTHE